MKMVTDGRGFYAIRRGFIFKEYFDLVSPGFWWGPLNYGHIQDCWSADLNLVDQWLARLSA